MLTTKARIFRPSKGTSTRTRSIPALQEATAPKEIPVGINLELDAAGAVRLFVIDSHGRGETLALAVQVDQQYPRRP